MTSRKIFLTGGTGYMGGRLIPRLLSRGHAVTALVRAGSEKKLPQGTRIEVGNALDADSLKNALGDCDTWVQLIGTPHPAPWKAAQFRAVDGRAVAASVAALPGSKIKRYVYLSVAHPAPAMRAYQAVRIEAEASLRQAAQDFGLATTFVRPWYVLGPGHLWPYAMIPLYKLLENIPATRAGALRMGLVTLEQMLTTLTQAVENPPESGRIIEVPEIRALKI